VIISEITRKTNLQERMLTEGPLSRIVKGIVDIIWGDGKVRDLKDPALDFLEKAQEIMLGIPRSAKQMDLPLKGGAGGKIPLNDLDAKQAQLVDDRVMKLVKDGEVYKELKNAGKSTEEIEKTMYKHLNDINKTISKPPVKPKVSKVKYDKTKTPDMFEPHKDLVDYVGDSIQRESNLVLDQGSLRSHIISMIAQKIGETDDIDQLAEWLKMIVGKELKPRGSRYIISSEDIKEAFLEAHGNSKVYDKCWKGYKKVPGKKRGEKGSCVKK